MDNTWNRACFAIYNGDLENSKRFLNNAIPFTVNSLLGKEEVNTTYKMDVLALILKGDVDHPGHFLRYKKMIDTLLEMTGPYRLFHHDQYGFTYSKYTPAGMIDLKKSLPISDQMKVYLKHLEVRSRPNRKKIVHILSQLDGLKKDLPPEEKGEIQIAKRSVARVCHYLHSCEHDS